MTDIYRVHPDVLIAGLVAGARFAVDDQRFIFNSQEDGELNVTDYLTGKLHRVVDPATGIHQVATVRWLQDALADGSFRLLVDASSADKKPDRVPSANLDRDEILGIDPHSEARHELLTRLHAAGSHRCDPELSAGIDKAWDAEMLERFGKRPKTSTVRAWMTWTDPALPLLSQLMSNSGRVGRAKRLAPEVREVIDDQVEKYWKERGRTLKDIESAGGGRIRELNVERRAQGLPQLREPSREAYRRRIRETDTRENYAKKHGEVAAERYWRVSGAGRTASYALELVMLDDTVLDAVACIATRNGIRWPAGRPYLVVALDLYSRCVLGWVLSFTPPTAHTAALCLQRAGREKTGLGASWDARYPILRQIGGRPTTVLTDNGTNYVSASFTEGLAEAGIIHQLAPIRAPKAKPHIERFFRTLNTWLLHKLPGHTLDPKEMRELGYDPETKAVLLVEELEALIAQFVNVYHISIHSTLNEAPAASWLRSTTARPRAVLDGRALAAMTYLTIHGRRATSNGVRWKYQTYRGEGLERALEANRAHNAMGGRLKAVAAATVKIKVDPENVGHIWLWDPSISDYVELFAVQSDYAWGLTLHQHLQARAWAKRRNHAFNTEAERQDALHALNLFIENIVPSLKSRERRGVARHLEGPLADAPIAHADASHDGMGEVVEHDAAGPEKLDWDVAPSRPKTGATTEGGSHDADPRDAVPTVDPAVSADDVDDDDDDAFDPRTGLFDAPDDEADDEEDYA